jgi:hypothetical protein
MTLSIKVLAAVVIAGTAYVAGLGPGEMFAAILAVDLAQFTVVLDHRGRISSLEGFGD